MPEPQIKAILFDVFGTVVDWRSGVIRDGERLGADTNISVDWPAFADAWRGEYAPSMDRVRRGELPWSSLDELHRESLERLLQRFGIEGLTEEDKRLLNLAWHRLDPWPDSVAGLERLRKRYIIAPLSNGNVSLLVEMARRAGLPWDVILSAELAGHYKPDPESYLTAVSLLDLWPQQTMMAAAHPDDLRAASSLGLRTGYIHRPLEWGPQTQDTSRPDGSEFDFSVDSVEELAEILT